MTMSTLRFILIVFLVFHLCSHIPPSFGEALDEDAGEEEWLPLEVNSTCMKAFGIDKWPQRSQAEIDSVFDFKALSSEVIRLRNINIGFGTTGTRSMAIELRRKEFSGCHWDSCGANFANPLAMHHELLQVCYLERSRDRNCLSKVWIRQLISILRMTATAGIQFITDTPINFVFRELLDLVPNLEISQSVRDPRDWVLDRIEKHSNRAEFMCDPKKPGNKGVSTPFHILQCIPHSQYVYENLIVTAHYVRINASQAEAYRSGEVPVPSYVETRLQDVVQYYVDFTQRSMNTVMAMPEVTEYTPFCVFDGYEIRSKSKKKVKSKGK